MVSQVKFGSRLKKEHRKHVNSGTNLLGIAQNVLMPYAESVLNDSLSKNRNERNFELRTRAVEVLLLRRVQLFQ
jgi:hypothetical protein